MGFLSSVSVGVTLFIYLLNISVVKNPTVTVRHSVEVQRRGSDHKDSLDVVSFKPLDFLKVEKEKKCRVKKLLV